MSRTGSVPEGGRSANGGESMSIGSSTVVLVPSLARLRGFCEAEGTICERLLRPGLTGSVLISKTGTSALGRSGRSGRTGRLGHRVCLRSKLVLGLEFWLSSPGWVSLMWSMISRWRVKDCGHPGKIPRFNFHTAFCASELTFEWAWQTHS